MAYKAIYKGVGDQISYTPSGADVAAGDVIVVGDLVGVAKTDIADGVEGILDLVGEFEVLMAAVTIVAGTKAYWDAANDVVTNVAGSLKQMGYFMEAKADTEDSVLVSLGR